MCTLADIRFVELDGDVTFEYEIDQYGYTTQAIRERWLMQPGTTEQLIWDTDDDLNAAAPYQCRCGCTFPGWLEVVDHCDMYVCRGCQRATRKWDGWDYRCPDCDVSANPDYHDRNPGYNDPRH